jgi:hypothetical protein
VSQKTLTGVPQDEVGQKVQDFIDMEDATEVSCTQEPGSKPVTWTLEATVPDA